MNKDAATIINSINFNEFRIREAKEKLEKINKSNKASVKIILDKKPGSNDNAMYDHYTLGYDGGFAKILISILKEDCINTIEGCEEDNINLLKQLKQLDID